MKQNGQISICRCLYLNYALIINNITQQSQPQPTKLHSPYPCPMIKQMASQANTKQLRKTKLLQSYRQTTANNIPTTMNTNRAKIMLTDLCPEQKSKIGQLVRTLQARKCQNQKLEERLIESNRKQKKYLEKIQELERIVQEYRIKQLKFKEELTLAKIKQQQRQKYIEHLSTEKQQQQKQLQKIKSKKLPPCVDQYALTDKIYMAEQAVQVNQKKKKYKNREIQTESQVRGKFGDDGRKYAVNNSRSFQKIMRNSQSQAGRRGRQIQLQIDNINQNRSNRVKSSGNSQRQKQKQRMKNKSSKHKKSQIIINDQQYQDHQQMDRNDDASEQNNDNDDQNQDQIEQQQIENDNEDDDDFNELAKKWLELKQRNMSKIKQSYDKSQQKIKSTHSHDRNTKSSKKPIGSSKTVGLPRQFNYNQKYIVEQEHEGSHLQAQDYLQNNQSFGPQQQQSLRQSRKNNERAIGNRPKELLDSNFDQIQLNRRLKQKNFSASSILRKGNPSVRQISQQSQKQFVKQDPKHENQKLKLSHANPQSHSHHHNQHHQQQQVTPNMKLSSASNNSRSHYGHNIDFYETDLLDIVSAINQK